MRRNSNSSYSNSSQADMTQLLKQRDKIKVILIGASQVGKTSISQRYFFDFYPDEYSSNLEEIYKKTV